MRQPAIFLDHGQRALKYRLLIRFILAILIPLNAFGQKPLDVFDQEKPPSISVDVSLVDVLFTVTNKKGKSIRNLRPDQFQVFEDDRLQTITNFSAEANLPLTIALLIDTSGSVRDTLRFEQAAAIQFFESTLVPQKDRALVMSFETKVDVLQDYTDDAASLSRAVRKTRAGGGTALYDAVYLAVTRKLVGQSGRRILVIITDGDDTASRVNLSAAIEAAQRNNVIVYAISTNSSGLGGKRNKRADTVLEKLSDATGGKVFYPFKVADLASDFNDITHELRFQYTLAYSPTNPSRDGAFRHIRIEPSDTRYVVRARSGYFAPKAEADP